METNKELAGKVDKVFRLPVKGKASDATGGNVELLPRRCFCAALSPKGEITKKESDSLSGLVEFSRSASLAWVDYWADNFDKDATPAAGQFGFSDTLISSLVGEYAINYQDFNHEMGLRLPSIYIAKFEVKVSPLLMLIRKNLILTIHPLSADRRFSRLRRYADTVLKRISGDIPAEDRLTLLLVRLIDENNDRNFEELRKIEEQGDRLSENLTDPAAAREKLGIEIYQMKHALITYLDALWATIDVVHALRYGDAELITNDVRLLERMTLLADDVNRQIELSEHMSEVLASGLEVLQSIYNNQLQALNNRLAMVMTYLTILGTAVLVPNTLATILSNTAFGLEAKDTGWYLALIIGSTIAATAGAYFWVKKKGWLPRKPE